MKTLILLLSLVALTACGQKSSNATLEVTQGFAFASTGFGGGLIVSGQNLSTGQRFSSAIMTGTSVKLNLPNGDWQFYAMGFETAGMTGARKCGFTKATLAGVDTNVSLSITTAGCADPVFGPNTAFSITGCGAFYSYNAGTDVYTPISGATSSSFCSTLPKDLQGKAPLSYRMIAFNSPLGANDGGDGFMSTCQNMGPANWPRFNIPFAVVLFDDNSCTLGKEIGRYAFPAGLGNGNPNFDSLFYGSSNAYFALPTNKMRRAYSPFMTMLPKLACSTGECLAEPSSVPGQRFVYSGGTTRVYLGETSATGSCSAAVTGAAFGYTTCGLEGKRAYADVTSTCAVSSCTGSITATIGSTPLTSVGLWSTNQPHLGNAYEIFNSVWQFVGIRNYGSGSTDEFFRYFQNNGGDEDERYYGEVGEARNMLGPNGVGGPLSQLAQNCSTLLSKAPFTHILTMFDEGVSKTYRVDVASSAATFPAYITGGTNPDINIKVYRTLNGVLTLIFRMDLLCDSKVGMLDNADDDDLLSGRKRGKRLFWNTVSNATARFEKFTIEYKANDIYRAEARTFEMTAADYFTTRSVSMESRFNGSSWVQSSFIEELKRENSSGEKISRKTNNETFTVAQMDYVATNGTYMGAIDFNTQTPGTNECFAVGTTGSQLQNTSGFTAIAVSTGCTTYGSRSAQGSSISGWQYKTGNFQFSNYKLLFPLLGL